MAKDREKKITTRFGYYRHRYHVRAAFQSVMFVMVVGGFCLYNGLVKDTRMTENFMYETTDFNSRRLLEAQDQTPISMPKNVEPDWVYEDYGNHRNLQNNSSSNTTDAPTAAPTEEERGCGQKAEPGWMAVFYFIGVLYMFLALAIVCDEFFVPALEEMSCERRMNLSMDVAGATLMAAGGSAPELFTNFFGTFMETEVGFGTIVGSAVFNVLFVIAMCALLAKEVLDLTWWPLFRDSVCYSIGLIVLALFVGVFSKDKIELYETIVLFGMYLIYVFIMWKNADIYKKITGKELEYPDEDEEEEEEEPEGDPEGPKKRRPSGSSNSVYNPSRGKDYFRWQGTFRAGILKLLRNPESWVDTLGNGIVARIYGDCESVFKQIDENKDGSIDKNELKRLFELLECQVTQAELDDVFDSLDIDKDGTICEEEFHKWYIQSEERIRSQVKHVFEEIDVNNSNTIDRGELALLLGRLDNKVTEKDIEDAIDQMHKTGPRDEISYEEFADWYRHSLLFERERKRVEDEVLGVWESVIPPYGGGCLDWINWVVVVPLVLVMTLTIPDVRRPGMGKFCYLAFILSILWIAVFAWAMVEWAETIGNTLGIPSVIMGLTILAAGTSVPDMLSSVIVARRGSGDMAVSSSIGSNIFDILVGLPLPWFIFICWPTKENYVSINSGSVWLSILILLAMVCFVIASIHCQGWKLTKMLAGLMLVFYFAFLAQAVVRELPFQLC